MGITSILVQLLTDGYDARRGRGGEEGGRGKRDYNAGFVIGDPTVIS